MAKGVKISKLGAKRMVNAVRAVEADTLNRSSLNAGTTYADSRDWGWCKVTAWDSGSSTYSVTRLYPDNAVSLVDDADFTTAIAAITAISKPTLPIGAKVWARVANRNESGVLRLILDGPGYGEPFGVWVENDGGSNGNATTMASWTYSAKDIGTGNTITYGTGLTPVAARPAVGTVTAGDDTYGIGMYLPDGTFKLLDANEVKTWSACA